jgi:tetratricopeptide (TPR) repeat protein
MQRLIHICGVLPIVILLATIAAARVTSVSGQILSSDGTPWADIDVNIQNTNTGQHFDVKTDKDGRYTQLGLPPGVYKITIYDRRRKWFTYSEIHTLHGNQENDVSLNFKKNVETAHPEEQKKIEGEETKFNDVKAHLDAGVGVMYDSDTLRTQLATAPADQRGSIQDRLNSDYQTAIREFQLAELAESPAEVKNLAGIWANLGEAYDYAGQYGNAIDAYQKAVGLGPKAPYYQNLSKAQASSALAQTSPKEMEQKLADASANCDKAAALDLEVAARCWKNIGILLSNKRDLSDAITPLRKTIQLDPKDAQAWFLLGSALLTTTETKQEGNEITAVFAPGTADAFQKCIAAEPKGPYASPAKEALDGLASMRAAEQTTVVGKEKK